jgi:hypothetical protein
MVDIPLAVITQGESSMNVTIRMPVGQTEAYSVKRPQETRNLFTITDAKTATDVLGLKDEHLISELKDLIKGCDFESITAFELARIGSRLYEVDLIDKNVVSYFISGNMALDKSGYQVDKGGKFNAIALFNQMLDDNQAYSRRWSGYAQQDSFKIATRSLVGANQAINALSFFASSNRNDLSVSVRA